jgi:hypothetical protein
MTKFEGKTKNMSVICYKKCLCPKTCNNCDHLTTLNISPPKQLSPILC